MYGSWLSQILRVFIKKECMSSVLLEVIRDFFNIDIFQALIITYSSFYSQLTSSQYIFIATKSQKVMESNPLKSGFLSQAQVFIDCFNTARISFLITKLLVCSCRPRPVICFKIDNNSKYCQE